MTENNTNSATLVKRVDAEAPNFLGRVRKIDLTFVVPNLFKDSRHMIVDECLRFRTGDRIHVDLLQTPSQTHVAWLVRFHHDVARSALNCQLKEFVKYLS